MRKFISLMVVALLVFAPTVIFASDFAFDKEKVVVGVEFSTEEKSIDDVGLLTLGLGSTTIKGILAVNDLQLTTYLANLGYEINESLIPYLLLGIASLEFDNNLNGSINNEGITLFRSKYDESDFAIGAGARGKVAEYEKFVLAYDARVLRTTGESNKQATLLPGEEDYKVDNKLKAEYTEAALSLMIKREFELRDEEGNKKVVDSITPFVGYRLSMIDLNLNNSVDTGCIDVANESNYDSVNNDFLVGAIVKVDDNWSASVNGVLGDNQGVNVGATFNF